LEDYLKPVLISADPATIDIVTLALRLCWPGVDTITVPTAAECIAKAEKQSADLILLQPQSHDMELAEAIEEVRRFTAAPLLVLGRRDDQVEVVMALSSGADDYIRLPCNFTELTVRIWAVMRRTGMMKNHQDEAPLQNGRLLLDLATHEAFLENRPIHLTSTEFRLLHVLIRNSGSVVSQRVLESALWGEDSNAHGLAKKYVQRLRKKLGDNAKAPHWIACIHGFGYRFVGPTPAICDSSVNLMDGTLAKPLSRVSA
jgi:DNA-binding response OmpR family regulator